MRVFVTVGNPLEPFDRAVGMLDDALGMIGESVDGLCQFGHCSRGSKLLPSVAMLSRREFEAEIERADVVVCHGGAGSLWTAIKAGHSPVAIARKAVLGEHVNDHQDELVAALAERGLVHAVGNVVALRKVLEEYRSGHLRRARHRDMVPSRVVLDSIAEACAGARACRPGLMGRALLRVLRGVGPSAKSMRIVAGEGADE